MPTTRFTTRVDWRQKIVHARPARVVAVSGEMVQRMGGRRVLIPDARDLEKLVRAIPRGRIAPVGALRRRLARDAGADTACPLVTGILLRIVSEAAEQDRREGRRRVTPYWRVVRDDGSLIDKFPGAQPAQARRLRLEGRRIGRVRRRWLALDRDLRAFHFGLPPAQAAKA